MVPTCPGPIYNIMIATVASSGNPNLFLERFHASVTILLKYDLGIFT
jgi:hypothetical protein